MSRDELIVLVGAQAGRLAAQDVQIATMAAQMVELLDDNESLAGRLAKLDHLVSRNSTNSSSPPSKDDDPGKTSPSAVSKRRGDHPQRQRGKQRGTPGVNLAWREVPDAHENRFPEGRCGCGSDLAGATD